MLKEKLKRKLKNKMIKKEDTKKIYNRLKSARDETVVLLEKETDKETIEALNKIKDTLELSLDFAYEWR